MVVEYWLIVMLYSWNPASPPGTKPDGSFEAFKVESMTVCESIKQSINNDLRNPTWAECWIRKIGGTPS